jgi:hypothetical protein
MAKSTPRSVPRTAPRPRPATAHRDSWRAVLEEWRRSGLRQVEFCRRRGIPPGTLSCWKHKLAREAQGAARPATSEPAGPRARPAFVPVRVVSPPTPAPADGVGELEIVLGGDRLVRVRGRVDAEWLRQVLGALEPRRC